MISHTTEWQRPLQDASGRFVNTYHERSKTVFFPSVAMYLISLFSRRRSEKQDFFAWNAQKETAHQTVNVDSQLRITWIGHASFLIEYRSMRLLLDPVFADLTFLLPRYTPPGIALDAIGSIDAILISHNHRDHLEQKTVQWLHKTYGSTLMIPLGDGIWMKRWGISSWREFTWWETHRWNVNAHDYIAITFVPAHHWSQRGMWDRNRSLWGGWVIETASGSCFFAGDTAYSTHFNSIGERFPSLDCALLPIGPCEPAKWMRMSHMSAEEAGRAFLDVGARRFIPMHWGTFGFGIDTPLMPLHRLENWWQYALSQKTEYAALSHKRLCPLRIGETLV